MFCLVLRLPLLSLLPSHLLLRPYNPPAEHRVPPGLLKHLVELITVQAVLSHDLRQAREEELRIVRLRSNFVVVLSDSLTLTSSAMTGKALHTDCIFGDSRGKIFGSHTLRLEGRVCTFKDFFRRVVWSARRSSILFRELAKHWRRRFLWAARSLAEPGSCHEKEQGAKNKSMRSKVRVRTQISKGLALS